ncbi:MAG TPA: hypothetical protein VEL28_02630 [Candidatus Binatia bacterium]|nr:hypothetical protein [Candidatus Binatia bacterium]
MPKRDPEQSPAAPLNPDAAFVVHVTGGNASDPDAVSGRAEHVTTGHNRRFHGIHQLAEFMSHVTAQVRAGSGGQTDDDKPSKEK